MPASRASGIFERTEEIFLRLVASGRGPWHGSGLTVESGAGRVSEAGSAYWGTSQAALSLAAVGGGHAVALLPDTYNFPLHLLDDMTTAVPTPLVHIHYHQLASRGNANADALLDARLGLPVETREWLRSRLPLGAA